MAAVSGHTWPVLAAYRSDSMVQTASVQRARCGELPGLGNHCASSWRDARRARCQLNDALWTRVRLGITRLLGRGTQHHAWSAPAEHPSDAGPSLGPQSMLRDLAGLRWQSQCRRRRPSGQRRPSTKPSRGRARVTHTAPRQPSLPSAEAGRATGGGRSTDGADAAECDSTSRNAFPHLYG